LALLDFFLRAGSVSKKLKVVATAQPFGLLWGRSGGAGVAIFRAFANAPRTTAARMLAAVRHRDELRRMTLRPSAPLASRGAAERIQSTCGRPVARRKAR
jgi:HAMP domain-containing protein